MGLGQVRPAERGASLAEYAIVAPLAFLLLFGVIEFSRLMYTYSQVWNAAREGARYATTVGDTDGDGTPNYLDCDAILAAAISRAVGVELTAADLTITVDSDGTLADCDATTGLPDPSTIDVDSGATVTVHSEIAFDGVVPLLEQFLDGIVVESEQSRSVFKGVVGA